VQNVIADKQEMDYAERNKVILNELEHFAKKEEVISDKQILIYTERGEVIINKPKLYYTEIQK
jgi:hypothetical protein